MSTTIRKTAPKKPAEPAPADPAPAKGKKETKAKADEPAAKTSTKAAKAGAKAPAKAAAKAKGAASAEPAPDAPDAAEPQRNNVKREIGVLTAPAATEFVMRHELKAIAKADDGTDRDGRVGCGAAELMTVLTETLIRKAIADAVAAGESSVDGAALSAAAARQPLLVALCGPELALHSPAAEEEAAKAARAEAAQARKERAAAVAEAGRAAREAALAAGATADAAEAAEQQAADDARAAADAAAAAADAEPAEVEDSRDFVSAIRAISNGVRASAPPPADGHKLRFLAPVAALGNVLFTAAVARVSRVCASVLRAQGKSTLGVDTLRTAVEIVGVVGGCAEMSAVAFDLAKNAIQPYLDRVAAKAPAKAAK